MAIGLGIANVYIGLIVEGQAASKYVVAYSVVRPTRRSLDLLVSDFVPLF